MSIAEFYLMNSRYYNGYDVGLDIYNPFDDDHDDHLHFAYDDMYDSDAYYDSDHSFNGRSDSDEFLETCLPPRFFPDPKKFPVEWMRRALKIRSEHCIPLTALPVDIDVRPSEKLEIPIFEHLWESLFYLKKITSVGMLRVENSESGICDDKDKMTTCIWKNSVECFSFFPKDTQDKVDCWFGMFNDLFVERIQSLIPSTLPYIAWVSIISHLSREKYSDNRTLLTKIGTISEDKDAQIMERFMIRECILRIVEITKIFYRCLHSELAWDIITVIKIKQTFPTLLKGLETSIDRLLHYLETPSEGISKFVDYSVKSNYSKNMSSFMDLKMAGNEIKDFDILKMVPASKDHQSNSNYFTMFFPDNEKENSYHLLCIDKNSKVYSKESVTYFFEQKALLSNQPPQLFCSADLVAGIGSDTQNGIELTVWDFDLPEKRSKLNMKNIEKGWTAVHLDKEPIKLADLKIRGLVKCSKHTYVMFHNGDSCFIADYELEGLSSFKQKRISLFENSVPLGVHNTTAFVLKEDVLVMLDIIDPDNATANKIRCGKEWKMQFNSNPESDSDLCILYRGNRVQIRKLDHELSLVKELTADWDCYPNSVLCNALELHFFDNMIYGFINNKANKIPNTNEDFFKETEEKDRDKCSLRSFLADRFINDTEHDMHFLLDTDSAEKGLIGLDWRGQSYDGPYHDMVENIFQSANVDIENVLTGFNRDGELVKLSMNVNDSFLKCDRQSIVCKCSAFSFVNAKVFKTLKETKDLMLPSVEKVFDYLREDEKKREALEKEQEEYKKMFEEKRRLMEEKEKKIKDTVKEYVELGTTVKATIHRWLYAECYGFATIDIDEGKQDVFVHKTCVPNKSRKYLKEGTSLQCQLKWDPNHPRPKAVNVKLDL